MQRCRFCNAELPEQADFCGNCGRRSHTLPDIQLGGGMPPAIDAQSPDTPTFISDASLPTVLRQGSQQDAPTFISDASLPTVLRQGSQQEYDSTQRGWTNDQDVQNRQLPDNSQTEESTSLRIDPFLPGIPSGPNNPPAGYTPMVQGTPQIGGVPSVQGTPSPMNTPLPATSNPLTAQGFGHGGAPSAPSPSMSPPTPPPSPSVPPSALPQSQPGWRPVEKPATISPQRPAQPQQPPKKARSTFNETTARIVAYPQTLFHVKNIKVLLLLAAIFIVLGGSGVLALDEASEQGDAAAFLGFDEPFERQLAEAISHGKAHAIATAYAVAATGTATALHHPFPQDGKLIYNDPLSNNSKTYTWVPGYKKRAGTDCFFANGAYHVVESNTNHFYYCIANNTSFSNFALQVEMTFIQGNYGGVLFRSVGQRHYVFRIGRDGSYALQLYRDDTGRHTRLLAYGRSAAINKSFNQANLMAVVARGGNIDLYVNQQYLTSVQDASYSQGQIGLEAEDHGVPAEVMFRNAKVYTLP